MTTGAMLTTPSQHPTAPNAAAPSPLAPLTPKQIQQQAKSTVSSSYTPSYQNLNQQQTQAQNIAAKREADNHYYLAWLDTQGQALQAHADAANATLQGLEQQLTGQQTQQFAALPGQLVTAASARAGNVSNEANANAFGRYLSPQLQANEQNLHGAAAGALAATGNTTDMLGAARANTGAYVMAGQDKQMSDLNTALTNIAQQRSKLQSSETGDVAKEIARLQGVEISKAEYNQNYATAAQKLGITLANTQSEINTRAANSKIAATNASTSATRAANSQMNSDRTYQLNVAKYDSATAKDLYERQHHLGAYKLPGNHPLGQSSQNVIYGKISTVEGTLRQLLTNGANPQTAYHTLLGGKTVNIPTGRTHNVKQTDGTYKSEPIYRTTTYKPPDVQILNAAYNLVTGFGLTKGDIAALEQMGLVNPGTRLKVADTTTKTGGAISSTRGAGNLGSL
jgi:hypothetical protein